MHLPLQNAPNIRSVLLVGGEGTVCATGFMGMGVKLWDLQVGSRGTLLRALGEQEHILQRGVVCLAYRGPLLASGGLDSTVRLWDLEAGGAARGLIRTGFPTHCLSCQTDVLLAGTRHNRINMYDTRVAEPLVKSLHLHSSHGYSDAVRCLAADDNYIISGSNDCTVAVYDRRAGKALKKLQLRTSMSSMSYSGSEVWAGDHRGMLHAFSMQAGVFKHLSQFDVGHTSPITGIHRSPGSLYTCSYDQTVKVHLPSAPPRTLCTLQQDWVYGLQSDGKRECQRSVVAASVGDPSRLLFIYDAVSGRRFLCDTGAQRSVIPASEADVPGEGLGPQLTTANGSPIHMYGVKSVELCFGGQRFIWDFVMTDIAFPILGADFLCAHNLLVDVKNNRLVDALTSSFTCTRGVVAYDGLRLTVGNGQVSPPPLWISRAYPAYLHISHH
ncbi:F-box/WD repeat-containing protein 9-like [Diretmus argenteus]